MPFCKAIIIVKKHNLNINLYQLITWVLKSLFLFRWMSTMILLEWSDLETKWNLSYGRHNRPSIPIPKKALPWPWGLKIIFDIRNPEMERNNFQIQSINAFSFLVFGKNWRDRFFLLFLDGPELIHTGTPTNGVGARLQFNMNSNFHYGFSKKDNYIGLETNKSIQDGARELYICPELILDGGKDFIFGLVIGFPMGKKGEKINVFLRFAYEF